MKTANKTTATDLRREFERDYGSGAEQFPADATLRKISGKIMLTRSLLSGKPRLRLPDGGAVKMAGDVAQFGQVPGATMLAIWWQNGQSLPGWVPLPSIDAMMEWTMDSCCPTPDGRILEPDHPDSWLRLLGLV